MSVPGPPQIYPRPAATDNQLEFWWESPILRTGDPDISSYQLACSSIEYVANFGPSTYTTRVPNLTNNQYYQFTIAAANQYGLGTPAAYRNVQAGLRATKNSIIKATMITSTTANVEWTFTQEPLEAANLGFAVVAVPSTPTAPTLSYTALINDRSRIIYDLLNETYKIKVFAVNDAGWQRLNTTNTINLNTTIFTSRPAIARNVFVSRVSWSSFFAQYTPGLNASNTTFLINNLIATPAVQEDAIAPAQASVRFDNLTAVTQYAFSIITSNNIESVSTPQLIVRTLNRPPTAINNLSVSNITPSSFTINWTGGLYATTYEYIFNGVSISPVSSTSTSAAFSSLTVGTLYSIIVRGTNSAGQVSSDPFIVTTPPNKPINVFITNPGPVGFTVNWTPGSIGATYYKISVDGGVTYPYNPVTSPYTITDLGRGGNYQVIVAAGNSSGSTPSEPPIPANTGPSPPTSLQVTSATQNSLTINWTASVEATSYNVSLNNGDTFIANTTSTTYTFTGLQPGTTYPVIIQSQDNSLARSNSATFAAITYPAAPTNIAINQATVTQTGCVITWTASYGATSYSIAINGTTPILVSNDPLVTTYTATNLTAGSTPSFVVRASLVQPSTGVTLSTAASQISQLLKPATPINLLSSSILTTSFTVNWTSSLGAQTYYLSLDNGVTYTETVAAVASPSYNFTNLAPGTTVQVVVKASNATGEALSATYDVLTRPAAPTNITSNNVTQTGFTVNWTPSAGATSYSIKINGGSYIALTNVSTYDVTGLSEGSTNSIQVRATNASGDTEATAVNFLTKPSTPSTLTVTGSSPTTIDISWTSGIGASSYVFLVNGTEVTPNPVDYSSSPRTATFTGLSPSTSYEIFVVAVNSGGSSSSAALDAYTTPSAPVINSSTITSNSFTVYWSGATGATSYTYKIDGVLTTASQDNGVSAQNATFSSAIDNTYTVIVIATNAGGSTSSASFSVPIEGTSAPICQATNITDSGFTVNWTGATGATSYSYAITPPEGTFVATPTGTSGSVTWSGLTPSTNYSVVISAINSVDTTPSTSLSVIPILQNPPNPPVLTFRDITATSFIIDWTGALYATSYSYTITPSEGTYVATPNGESGTVTWSNLTYGTTYDIVITAINGAGSAPSTLSVTTVTPLPTTQPELTVTEMTPSSYTISWTGGDNATSYVYKIDDATITPLVDNGVSAKNATISGTFNKDLRVEVIAITSLNSASSRDFVWTQQTRSGIGVWSVSTSSADGTKIMISQQPNVYTSTDSGINWTVLPPVGSWHAMAGSADGNKLIIGNFSTFNSGSIYTSTNSGVSWIERTMPGAGPWIDMHSSSDGTKLVITKAREFIQTSTDSGATWIEQTSAGAKAWFKVAGSSDGSKIVVGVASGYIYTSSDSGVTWIERTGAGAGTWSGVASNADATKLVAAVSGSGYIYTSTDSGVTWIARTSAGLANWQRITSNSDGTKLAIINHTDQYIYISSDSGITWIAQITLGKSFWRGISSSSDGNKMVTGSDGYIYTYGMGFPISVDLPSMPILSSSNIDSEGFTISWTGGNPASSYTYKINGIITTPITDNGLSAKNARFSGSINNTYTVEVIATNYKGSTSSGADWTLRTGPGTGYWGTIASSYDGSKLVMVDFSNINLWASTDYGVTWNMRRPAQAPSGVASSADGNKLVVGVDYGYIYTSSDSALSWTARTQFATNYDQWELASSSDGTKLAFTHFDSNDYYDTFIYTSTDSGVTWVERTGAGGSLKWNGIASSADGTKLVTGKSNGYLYTSTDSGVNWDERTSAGTGDWRGIASSIDGTKLVTSKNQGYIYTSTDSGVTWVERTSLGTGSWSKIASSHDGTKLLTGNFAGGGGNVYISTDSGVTWTVQTSLPPNNLWEGTASNSDGTRLVIGVKYGYIYTYYRQFSVTM